MESTYKSARKPIVRSPFPPPVPDRSPLFGISSMPLLRACFRVGEALNVGSQAVRESRDIIIELYARVKSSWREPAPRHRQHFVLHDLYHDRPPHLHGTSEAYGQSPLWELDSKVFLERREEGAMCRCVGKMKSVKGKWELEVLSIWEASWEDVDHVAGIYAA